MIQSLTLPRPYLGNLHIGLLFCCLILVSTPLSARDTASKPTSEAAPKSDQSASTAEAAPKLDNSKVKVIVEGIKEPLLENVQAFLDINDYADKDAPEEIRLRWLHRNAEDQIRQALQPFGYFEPTIESSLEKNTEGDWEARYRIQPGRPLRIAELDVRVFGEGANDPTFQKLVDNLPLTQGQILDQPKYEQIKSNLSSLATERGYFDARFIERKIRVDLQAYQATIILHYNTGKRYKFGNITFRQDFLSPELLARYPRFKSGDPYNVNKLLRLQRDLSNTPYFGRVEVNAPPEAETDIAPVDVELDPGKRYKFSAGIGYGTDTGVRGKLLFDQRWINRRGHHYQFELGYSEIKSLIGIKYIIPGKNPSTDEYTLIARYVQQDYEGREYENYTLGGGLQKRDGKWLKKYGLRLGYEQYTIGIRPETETLLLIPSMDWTWIDADDRIYARRGLMFGFGLQGAAEALLSDTNFLQGIIHVRGYYGLNDDSRLIARGDFGMTAVDDFEKLPPSLRFFAGGDASVRGYAYESIGPTDPDGTVVGGKNLLVASLEYEHRVWKDWGVAAFVDTGDAFDGTSLNLKTGAGVGIRWLTPVGPLRLDFSTGLDRPPGDAFRFSFSIGPDL